MVIYDLRTNNIDVELIRQQYADQLPAELGKNGAFWKWLGDFATGLLNNSADILNAIFGGATADNITYAQYASPNAEDYNKLRKQNTNTDTQQNNTMLYVGIGSLLLLGGIFLVTRDKKRRR